MPSITRKPQANRQERRDQIERRLLDATERLMNDGASFTELSVDRLATEAGISRASFYIYFEDKGYLLRRLATQVFDDLIRAAQPSGSSPPANTTMDAGLKRGCRKCFSIVFPLVGHGPQSAPIKTFTWAAALRARGFITYPPSRQEMMRPWACLRARSSRRWVTHS